MLGAQKVKQAPAAQKQERKENIFVIVRVRPKTANELQRGVGHTIEPFNGTTLIFDPSDAPLDVSLLPGATGPVHRQKNVAFSFDSVLGPEATQEHVYDKIRDVIPSLLEGFNSSVLAYGQTSAGKTFTMLGDRFKGEGVMVRSMRDLFLALDEQKRTSAAGGKNVEYALSFSYLEVYNEQILDLLAAAPAPVGGLELQDGTEGDVVVLGLSEHKPHSVEEVMSLLERGNANRSQSPTDANETSSRSHAVLQVHVRRTERKSIAGKVKTIIRRSKLSMIDLAGSERAKATVNREVSLRKEGQNINKSLLALGNCINALSQGSNHVPFRDSKLTRLLKDSLGGNCRTIMIANVSPCISNYEDTYNTLNYAKRAKNIKVTLSKTQLAVASSSDNFNLAQIEALRDENERLREMLKVKNSGTAPSSSKTGLPSSSLPEASSASASTSSSASSSVASLALSALQASSSSVDVEELERATRACSLIRKEAESLFARKLGFHKACFSAWVKCQWAKVRMQLLEQQQVAGTAEDLRPTMDVITAQLQMHEYDIGMTRRQIAQVEQEVEQLRDESSGLWSAFGPKMSELRDHARAMIEIHAAKCDSEMLKRECNVLRMLVEAGWELHQDVVVPTTPQMLSKTPVSLRLRTGSPGLKIQARKLNFAPQPVMEEFQENQFVLKLDHDQQKPAKMQEEVAAPQKFVLNLDQVKVAEPKVDEPRTQEQQVKEAPKFVLKMDLASSTFSSGPPIAATLSVDTPSVAVVPPAPSAPAAAASIVAPKIEEPSPSDEIPPAIRSFGSSLSMLHSALEGASNVSLGSLSLDASSSTSFLLQQPAVSTVAVAAPVNLAPVATAPAPSASSAAAPARLSVRERLQRMVRERVAAKKEEDDFHPNTLSSPKPSLHVDQLVWSPVVGQDMTSTNVSDLSLLINDGAKISLSFAHHIDDVPSDPTQGQALLAMRERKIEALKFDIKQLETIASPGKATKSVRLVDEENALNNQAPSTLIPKPALRSRRVLATKK